MVKVYQMRFAGTRALIATVTALVWLSLLSASGPKAWAQNAPPVSGSRDAKLAPAPAPPELVDANRLIRRGEFDRALERVDLYLKEKPRDTNGRFLRGVILVELKRTEDAISAFTELSQEHPDLAEPHNNLAVLFAGQGRLDRARYELEQAVLANPESATALENLADIHVRLAAQFYERSLAIEGNNRLARTKLNLARELGNQRPRNRAAPPAPPFPPSESATQAGEKKQ